MARGRLLAALGFVAGATAANAAHDEAVAAHGDRGELPAVHEADVRGRWPPRGAGETRHGSPPFPYLSRGPSRGLVKLPLWTTLL